MSSLWTIRRSTSDAKVSGVCGGVARHWGVDPVLVRVGCALLALSGGIGVVLYLAGWLLLPKEGREEPAVFDIVGPQARQWSREVWLVLVGIGCLVAFTLLAPLTPFGVGPAVILALVWYFGYYKHSGQRSRGSKAADRPQALNTPFAQAAQAWRQRIAEVQAGAAQPRTPNATASSTTLPHSGSPLPAPGEEGYEPVGPASSLPPAHPWGAASSTYSGSSAPDVAGAGVRPQGRSVPALAPASRASSRSARRLRLVALAVLALTLTGLGVADGLGVAVPLAGYFSAALLVLGLALVAAAWLGRARGIMPLALLVLLATVATTVTGPVARSLGWESEQRTYTNTSQLGPGDQRQRGRLQVDLTQLSLTSDAAYTAHVGVGAIEVSVPGNTNVVLNWGFEAGAVIVDKAKVNSGSDLHGTERLTTRNPNSKTLVLNLSVGQGVVQVRR